ncbi:MAG TPA: dehydrogenase, partial [Candidatus Angelobacter sp.]|nr:dehydrogenase [Candidatus Angelobacter sp.]
MAQRHGRHDTTASPVLVVNVSLTGPERDHDAVVTFLHHDVRLVRIGTSGDVAAAEALVASWADRADAIAVTGIREARASGLYDGELEAIDRVRRATTAVPVTDGRTVRDVLQEWAVRHVQNEMPGYFTNARTLVLGGENHARTVRVLREFTDNIEFAEPLQRWDVAGLLHSNPVIGLASDVGLWPLRLLPGQLKVSVASPGHRLSNALARRAAKECHVVVATYDELMAFGIDDLAGKALITSAVSDERLDLAEELLRERVD